MSYSFSTRVLLAKVVCKIRLLLPGTPAPVLVEISPYWYCSSQQHFNFILKNASLHHHTAVGPTSPSPPCRRRHPGRCLPVARPPRHSAGPSWTLRRSHVRRGTVTPRRHVGSIQTALHQLGQRRMPVRAVRAVSLSSCTAKFLCDTNSTYFYPPL